MSSKFSLWLNRPLTGFLYNGWTPLTLVTYYAFWTIAYLALISRSIYWGIATAALFVCLFVLVTKQRRLNRNAGSF